MTIALLINPKRLGMCRFLSSAKGFYQALKTIQPTDTDTNNMCLLKKKKKKVVLDSRKMHFLVQCHCKVMCRVHLFTI